MSSSVKAGAIYFLIVFCAGFLLGTLRVLFIVPKIGELFAVLFELPVILTIAWQASKKLIKNFVIPTTHTARLTMGMAAFLLLMLAEFGLSVFIFDRTIAQHLASYKNLPALIGFVGQVIFFFIPAIQLDRTHLK